MESQSYGASPAIWDHTVLPATRHRWARPALTPPMHAGTRFTYPGGYYVTRKRTRRESNSRPLGPESNALTTEPPSNMLNACGVSRSVPVLNDRVSYDSCILWFYVVITQLIYLSRSVTDLIVDCQIIVLVVARRLRTDIVHGACIQLNIIRTTAFA